MDLTNEETLTDEQNRAMNEVHLPPGIKVIVRDWLNANHVLIAGRDGCVLIDSGYGAHAQRNARTCCTA